jgi:hypothetical protein
MDPTRQIRLLIPPFFFFSSFLSAIFTSNVYKYWHWLSKQDIATIAGFVAFIGVASLPMGYLLSTITIIFFKLFRFFGLIYESSLSEEDLTRIWPLLNTKLGRDDRSKKYLLCGKRTSCETRWFASVILDHEIIYTRSKGIYEWMLRAYSAFWVAACSAMALIVSIILVIVSGIDAPNEWWVASTIFLAIMILGAYLARRDSIQMEEFQSHRTFDSGGTPIIK